MARPGPGEPAPSPLWIPSVCVVDDQVSSVVGGQLGGVERSRAVQTCPEVAKVSVEYTASTVKQ